MSTQSIPLEKIRQVEAEVAEQIRQARQTAEAEIVDAHKQAAAQKEQAITAGHRRGIALYLQRIADAEGEGKRILQASIEQAAQIKHAAAGLMESVVARAVLWVAGLEEDEP